MRRLLRTLLVLAALAAGPASAARYVQDAGSTLTFAGTFQGEAFQGQFPHFSTALSFDPERLQDARLDVTITMASATTHKDEYDGEMRGGWFLDVVEFPKARFVATRFRRLAGQGYAADGTLTLRGIAKPVTFYFTWKPGDRPVLSGSATINRLDYGVGTKGDWADSIPKTIDVTTRVVLRRK